MYDVTRSLCNIRCAEEADVTLSSLIIIYPSLFKPKVSTSSKASAALNPTTAGYWPSTNTAYWNFYDTMPPSGNAWSKSINCDFTLRHRAEQTTSPSCAICPTGNDIIPRPSPIVPISCGRRMPIYGHL